MGDRPKRRPHNAKYVVFGDYFFMHSHFLPLRSPYPPVLPLTSSLPFHPSPPCPKEVNKKLSYRRRNFEVSNLKYIEQFRRTDPLIEP